MIKEEQRMPLAKLDKLFTTAIGSSAAKTGVIVPNIIKKSKTPIT